MLAIRKKVNSIYILYYINHIYDHPRNTNPQGRPNI